MKRTIKFILILCAVVCVVVVLWEIFICGFGVCNSGVAASAAALAQGRERGSVLDEAGCLKEALARHNANRLNEVRAGDKPDTDGDIDFRKHVVDPQELRGCLQSSRALEGFCKDVPYKDASLLEWKEVQQAEPERAAASRAHQEARVEEWVARACSQQRLSSDVYCPSLMGTVVNYCSSPARADKLAHTVPQPPSKK